MTFRTNTTKRTRLATFLLLLLSMTACGRHAGENWALTDIQGFLPDLQFTLSSGLEEPVTAKDFSGRIVLLYFGYLHCPDVCPMTLSKLAAVLHDLGDAARDVRILFVSVDPERDTPDKLNTYAQAFSPQVVGVTGTPREIEAMAKRYRVAYEAEPADPDGNYEVMHSKAVYVFDWNGQARLMISDTDTSDAIVHDLRQLVASAP